MPPPESTGTKTKVVVFCILLAALLALVYAFASGHLNMGVSGAFTYLIYIFLGLIASIVCYGLLSSMGEIRGHKYATTIKLGGAIVGLVVVGGGGLVYEKYVMKPSTIDIRLVFYLEKRTSPQKITGSVAVLSGNKEFPASLNNQSAALIQGLPSSAQGNSLNLTLDCTDFEVNTDSVGKLKVDPDNPIYIKLNHQKIYALPEQADLQLDFNGGSAVNYIRRPDDENIIVQLNITSKSDLIVPIDKSAEFQVLSDSGVPMVNTVLSADQFTLMQPHATKEVYFEGFIPSKMYEMTKGKTAILKLKYKDLSGGSAHKTWQTDFDFKLDE